MPQPKTLVVTINGPFAYLNDKKSAAIRLMAPMCPQHLCVISNIESGNQYVIEQYNSRNHGANFGGCISHQYELKFKHNAPAPQPTPQGFLQCTPPKPNKNFVPKQWRFWLSLPYPDTIVPVDPANAHIIKPGKSVPGSYAIGARFIYRNWNGQPIPLLREKKPVKRKTGPRKGKPVKFVFGNYDDHADLDVDFSSPLRDDLDHEDAVSCFEHLMSALGLPWSMFIPGTRRPSPNRGIESSKLNDCRAAVAWVI
jgi:hypothetical protein